MPTQWLPATPENVALAAAVIRRGGSVARAVGETVIDAEITVRGVHSPLPWEPQPAGRPVLSLA